MTELSAGDRLARLLLPHRRRGTGKEPDHDLGWWFAGAPPEIVQQALGLCQAVAGERPNDQPPEEWLVEQAALRGGVLSGFVAPTGPASPRMQVDAIIVPCEQAVNLAEEISKLWPLDEGGGTALDLAVVEGLTRPNTTRHRWGWPGSAFLDWSADRGDWLGAVFCSFWWD
jgi:hypothetical protein